MNWVQQTFMDAPAIAAGLVRDGDLDKKEARREAKACVAVASLDDDKARVSWEAFLHAMATKKEGWHVWWRGDKIQKDTKSFDASGGVGLMGAISDERLRLATEKKRAEIEAEDAREESALVAKMRRLRAKREAQAQQQQEIDKELEPQSPRVLPPILAQMAVYSDDEGASPRAELLGGVRRFLHDAVVRAEAADSDTAKMAATGATSTTTIGIALDARSMFLYGRAYPPGPPPDFNPPSETGEDRDPEAVATFLMKASRPAPRPPKAEDGEDQGDVDAVTSNMPGRLSGFGYKLSMGEANGAPAADGGDSDGDGDGAAPPEEPRDTVLDSFRDKMKRDLVLLMAYQQHVGALPVNLKKLCKQLWLFDWPKLGLLWDGVIDDLKADGVIYCSVDQNNRPYEVYF